MLSMFPNFIIAVAIVIATVYFLKFLISPLWLDENHRNPSWVGVVLGAYTISFIQYFTSIIYATNMHLIQTVVFFVINAVFVPLYIYLLRSDPGYIKKNHSAASEWKAFLAVLDTNDPLPQFCLSCMVRKPIRGKHCRSCGQCVARFDHHCGWLNNCVGINNHAPFLGCLVLVIMNHVLFARFCIVDLLSVSGAPPFLPANYSIPFYFEREPLLVLLAIFHGVNVGWQSWLLYNLIIGIRDNVTTNEVMNGQRYDYLKDPVTGQWHNPFNRGFLENFKDLLSPSIDWFHFYSLPRHINV